MEAVFPQSRETFTSSFPLTRKVEKHQQIEVWKAYFSQVPDGEKLSAATKKPNNTERSIPPEGTPEIMTLEAMNGTVGTPVILLQIVMWMNIL